MQRSCGRLALSEPDGQAAPSSPPPRARRGLGPALARGLGLVTRVVLVAVGLAVIAAGVLAVRLSLAPLPVTSLLRHFARRGPGNTRIAIGAAILAWQPQAPGAPLVLSLSAATLRRPDGSVAASATSLAVGLPASLLLLGAVRPTTVNVVGGSLALRRDADGTVGLDTGATPSNPPATRPARQGRLWSRLSTLTLMDVAATVNDRALGLTWQAYASHVDALGLDSARPSGDAALRLTAGGQHADVNAQFGAQAGTPTLSAQFSAIDPARIGLPASYAALPDLPLAGSLTLNLGPNAAPHLLDLALSAGAGRIPLAGGALAVMNARAQLAIDFAARHAALTSLQAVLAPGADGHQPVLHAGAGADWTSAGDGTVVLTLAIDRLAFASLGGVWPPLASPSARAWMLANATAGTANDLHVSLGLARARGAITLTTATGGLRAAGLTLSWLRPVPPLTDVAATLAVQSPDALLITIASAIEAPADPATPPLRLSHGTMRIAGLTQAVQTGTIEADLAGPVAQAVALLGVPRLHLLADHPVQLGAPAGSLAGQVRLSLPLEAHVTIAQIPIAARFQFTDLHLGGVLAGKDLDRGQLALVASASGLTLNGTADLAAIPSTLAVAYDFRAGPPTQLVARYQAQGSASLAQIAKAGLPTGGLADGTIAYTASLAEQRGGAGALTAHVDLRGASLRLPGLGWSQAQGGNGSADVAIRLDHDRVVAVDHLAVLGPTVDILAHAEYAAGQPVAVDFDHIVLGNTRAEGVLRLPPPPAPLHLDLRGTRLDLAPRMQGQAHAQAPPIHAAAPRRRPATAVRGRPWTADLSFARVDLGPANHLSDIHGHAENDGLLVQRAVVSGAAGAGRFAMHLAPDGAGRRLLGTATDAGGLMAALDLTGAVRGGTLTLDARYDDTTPDHALTGNAKIDNLRIVGATAVARLLQAMTLYGLVDVLRGPGLGITHLVVPFGFADQVLTLNNARAWSSSLGFTARGQIDLAAQRADLTGTVVPGYFFNTLPGKLPLIGKLFSPEKGGGLFAATYSLKGPLAKPAVSLNPLAALAPGFLRDLGAAPSAQTVKPPAPPPAAQPAAH